MLLEQGVVVGTRNGTNYRPERILSETQDLALFEEACQPVCHFPQLVFVFGYF